MYVKLVKRHRSKKTRSAEGGKVVGGEEKMRNSRKWSSPGVWHLWWLISSRVGNCA